MKTKIISVFTAFAILFVSCTNNNEIDDDLQQKILSYNKNYKFQNEPSSIAKINKQKALMLALVDAGAGYSVSGVWAIPVVGVYAGLWISFAASWAASGANSQRTSPSIPTKINTLEIENIIRNNSIVNNPYDELGQKHNIALNDLGTTEISMLDTNGKLNFQSESYMINSSFMTTSQSDRISFINNSINRNNVEKAFVDFGKITTIEDLNKQISLNSNSTTKQKEFVISVSSYLEQNQNSLNSAEITKYIDGLEDIVIKDSTLSSKERQELLQYLSVLNYSYCFWERQT